MGQFECASLSPISGGHVGEHLETPTLDEFMSYYNAIVGTSNYAKVIPHCQAHLTLPCFPTSSICSIPHPAFSCHVTAG